MSTGRSRGRRVRWALVLHHTQVLWRIYQDFRACDENGGATRSLLQWCPRRGARAAESDSLLMS